VAAGEKFTEVLFVVGLDTLRDRSQSAEHANAQAAALGESA
jgi:hypothetical protein